MFNVGDFVKCAKPIHFLDYDKIYTVEISGDSNTLIRLVNQAGWFRAEHFKGWNTLLQETTDYITTDTSIKPYEHNIFVRGEESRLTTLPTDSKERKDYPMLSGCLKYFPAALAGVAYISKLGNDKHNPGEPLHHARGKSTDQGDCIIRHLTDTEDLLAALSRGDINVTKEMIINEANQLAWRALAYSQELHEKFGSPLAPGAKK